MLTSGVAIVDRTKRGPVMVAPCDDRWDPCSTALLGHVTASEETPRANNNDVDVSKGVSTYAA
ncbi:hypothetical protein KB1_09760 [Cutibacterium modestum]|uniref:Uncharacterized protein n=1 Tax=Cutibacterium modestum TaxID=2559073 RepID=A0AAD1KPU2_9ACTN|nr:hypothetical protein [Cutibacterium modestum 31N]BCY24986.1 hypothetical protein KB1_09760 [Cutibacterium modestum]